MSERFLVVGEVRFGHNREVVVSVKGGRAILGQRLEFPDDDGKQQRVFLKHAPSLDLEQTELLRDVLHSAAQILRKGAELRASAPDNDGGEEE